MSRKSTIILSIAGSAVLAASVVLFIVGAINLNAAKNRGGKGDKKEEKLYALTANGYTTEYKVDDEFTFDGVCYAVYTNSDNVKAVTPEYNLPNMKVAGTKVITLSYTEEDVTVTYKYSIAVGEGTLPDPVSDDAKEQAAVELIKTQLQVESKPFAVSYSNMSNNISLDFYMSNDIIGREFLVRYPTGTNTFGEVFYANTSSTIKRFVYGRFVGYIADLSEDNAYDLLREKYYIPVELNAKELEFVSYNGHNAIFSTESASLNEAFCRYANYEYDAENNRKLYVNLYNEINKIIITPEYSSYVDMEVMEVNFSDDASVGSINNFWDFDNYKNNDQVNYSRYAYIEPSLLPMNAAFDRYFVQPESGNYDNVSGSSPTKEERNRFTIGFTACGDARSDYGDILVSNGYTYDSESGKYTKAYRDDDDTSWEHYEYLDYIHVIELEYISSDLAPMFSQGVLAVRHSFVIE